MKRLLKVLSVCAATLVVSVFAIAGCGSSKIIDDDAGATEGGTCTTGQVTCGTGCVDTSKDPSNCGACGTACKTGEVCTQGMCATSCGPGTMKCGALCVDPKVDPQNCGACGTACATGEVCNASMCSSTCGSNQTKCGGDGGPLFCANTKTDNANCGACGVTCTQGKVCSNGQCSTSCQPNEQQCTDMDGGAPYCASTQSDNQNCGMCGKICGALESCTMGTCSSSCAMGQTLCAPDGGMSYCANLQTDNINCGTCGKTCSNSETCVAGVCKTGCIQGQTLCTPDAGAPYCANLQSDNANCGVCGTLCTNGQTCVNGTCKAICNPTALVLGDSDANSNTAYTTILQNVGFTVTTIASGTINYANNPAAGNFGVIVITPGTTYGQDMPAAGQNAIIAAQKVSTGILTTEWFAYNQTASVYATLAPLVLFSRTSGTTSVLSYTLTQNGHPIWTGLPNTFNTVSALGANIGNTLVNGGQQIATCTQCTSIGVATRTTPGARIVQLSHAAAYNGVAWYNDANLAKLTANSAQWAAGCK